MRLAFGGARSLALVLLILGALLCAVPGSAQWTRVTDVPATLVPTVWANGDTIVASADSFVYVSTSGGAFFRQSTKVAPGVRSIQALWVRNGRLYAGTLGQGVHVSDDLGASWQPFNEGLVGGFEDSQLKVTDLPVRGDSIYAATLGASVYVRNLNGVGAWAPLGGELELNQASNVNGIGLGGGRLIALGGSNGQVFINDPGDVDWTVSNLDNLGIHAGVIADGAAWTGTGWVVGTNAGVFRSVAGQEPWTRFSPGLGSLDWVAFAATDKGYLFAVFDTPRAAVIEESGDDGATWQNADTQPNVFVQKLVVNGNFLYASRGDGLWRRPLSTTAVEGVAAENAFRFAVAGAQPFGSSTAMMFDLPRDESVTIDLFDVHGRLVGDRVEGRYSSGRHEIVMNLQRLGSGVYLARLTAGGRHRVVRLVHVK
ncbi:MAG TPA: hypothetical protein VFS09_11320 [Candidatus Eisenbacteria bacterium]|nr:hypothetical protein [Candidatus Eisenbacteria bacterium]